MYAVERLATRDDRNLPSQETFRTRESGNTTGKTAYVRLYQVDSFQHLQGNTLDMECRFLLRRIKQMPLENPSRSTGSNSNRFFSMLKQRPRGKTSLKL